MSKSKGELLKEKFQAIIDRCKDAGNEKAVAVYEKILKNKLAELQKKSSENLPGLEKTVQKQKEKAKVMLADLEKDQDDLDELVEKTMRGYVEAKNEIWEKVKGLNGRMEETENIIRDTENEIQEKIKVLDAKRNEMVELVGNAIADGLIIKEIAMELVE